LDVDNYAMTHGLDYPTLTRQYSLGQLEMSVTRVRHRFKNQKRDTISAAVRIVIYMLTVT